MGLEDLRKKLKPTSVASMEEQDKQLDSSLGRNRSNNDHLKIVDGYNLFRIFPPHDTLDDQGKPNPFAEPKVVVFLPAIVNQRDDQGKDILDDQGKPKKKEGVKPVFNAKIHGKRDKFGNPLTKDLVDEFIGLALSKSKSIESEEERKAYLLPIFGQYSKDSAKRVNGIIYNSTWEAYAVKISGDSWTFGILEIKKVVKNRLNAISAVESANEPLGTDPFTDLDEGRGLVVVYNSKADKAEDYYTTEIDSTTVEEILEGGRKIKTLRMLPITDEQLEKFSKATPLAKIFRNIFSRRDLDLQITGLEMIDTKWKLGIFKTEEFQTIVEELLEEYPEETGEGEEVVDSEPLTTNPTTTTTTISVRTDLPFDDDVDMFTSMTREEMKEFSKDNSTGIIIKPASLMTDDDLRNRLREWMRSEEVKVNTTEEQSKEVIVTEPEVKLSAKERLEQLKNKK